jgi:hypothetical protein
MSKSRASERRFDRKGWKRSATWNLLSVELILPRGDDKLRLRVCAIFWGGRIIIQLFFYDQAVKRSRPIANLLFLATFNYLCSVFTVACLRHNR